VLLSPFITTLFNISFTTGCFPQIYKHAIVSPLLKKENLDSGQLKNFRPVSSLSMLSKLLEKAVQKRLLSFLDSTGGLPPHQSAYRQWHSTETALTKLVNDLLLAADRGEVSALCLLDLTAAFDTVDHEILLSRLETRFGVIGKLLDWFRSYLDERSFAVAFSGSISLPVHLTCSVPHGVGSGTLVISTVHSRSC
jgi:hypothetical protein